MVPLPDAAQLLTVEILRTLIGSVRLAIVAGLKPSAWRTTEVTLQSHHRPTVLPRHRHQAHRSANRVEVLHKECPPRAVLRLYDAALMGVGAGRRILVHRTEAELCAVLADAVFLAPRHLGQRGGVIAIGLVGGDDTGLVRAPDALRTGAERTTIGAVVGGDQVVHPVYLIHVMTLAHAVALRDNDALRALLRPAHIRLQFRTLHLAVAVDGIHLAVVVEQHAQVVDVALHIMVHPRPLYLLTGVALQAFAVHVREEIELTVIVADAGRPDALAIDFLMVLQRERIVAEVEAVETVTDVLPVHEILRVEDHESRYGVHRRTSQVVVVAHPQHVRIGELIIEQRVSKRAVPIVGSPRLRLRRSGQTSR